MSEYEFQVAVIEFMEQVRSELHYVHKEMRNMADQTAALTAAVTEVIADYQMVSDAITTLEAAHNAGDDAATADAVTKLTALDTAMKTTLISFSVVTPTPTPTPTPVLSV